MTYSYTIPADKDDVAETIDQQINTLADGPGKDEANAHSLVVLMALPALAAAVGATAWTATVSGHGGDDSTTVTLSVTKVAEESTT